MDPSLPTTASTLAEPKYINFPSLPADAKHPDGSPALNRHSSTITRGHDFPGARVRQLPLREFEHLLISLGYAFRRWRPRQGCHG